MKRIFLAFILSLLLGACAARPPPPPSNEQYMRAIRDFNRAIELDPDLAGVYLHRGETYIKMGQIEDGCADLRKACELGKCSGLEWARKRGYCH